MKVLIFLHFSSFFSSSLFCSNFICDSSLACKYIQYIVCDLFSFLSLLLLPPQEQNTWLFCSSSFHPLSLRCFGCGGLFVVVSSSFFFFVNKITSNFILILHQNVSIFFVISVLSFLSCQLLFFNSSINLMSYIFLLSSSSLFCSNFICDSSLGCKYILRDLCSFFFLPVVVILHKSN